MSAVGETRVCPISENESSRGEVQDGQRFFGPGDPRIKGAGDCHHGGRTAAMLAVTGVVTAAGCRGVAAGARLLRGRPRKAFVAAPSPGDSFRPAP